MANEITVAALLSATKNSLTATLQDPTPVTAGSLNFTMSGNNSVSGIMSVPTTAGGTAIPKGSIGTPGWFLAINTDATNFVTVLSAVSGTALVKMKPGEVCLFRFSTSAPAMLADTGACIVRYLMLED
jgi:hypothetical protein